MIRLFFRTLRRIIGPFMLLGDKLTTPKGVVVQRKLNDNSIRSQINWRYINSRPARSA